MALFIHILTALSSLVFTVFIMFKPSAQKLKVSYLLIFATLASGTYLVFNSSGHILQVCAMGLLFSTISAVGVATARKKIAY